MRRRTALVVLASVVGPVSGCGTRLPRSARTPSSTPTDSAASPASGVTTDPPPLGDVPCPPAGVNSDAAVCPGDRDDATVAIRTNRRSVPLDDAESVRFVLINETGEPLEFNPHNPDVYRFVERGYERVDRQSSGSGVTTVPPDGTYSWKLTALSQFERLTPGRYLFAASVPTAGTMATDWVTCLSPVRLTAERG